jgi:hypothetical protein
VFTRTDVTNIVITPTYTTSGGTQLVVTGAGNVATKFMGLIGFSSLNINVTSTIKWGNSRLRVALVLDNTRSMADSGKITALKTATNNLLTQLKNAAVSNGDVYVSIVPFVKDVNVDPVNFNASWIDWTDWDAVNGSCSKSKYTTRAAAYLLARAGRRTITTLGMAASRIAADQMRPARRIPIRMSPRRWLRSPTPCFRPSSTRRARRP